MFRWYLGLRRPQSSDEKDASVHGVAGAHVSPAPTIRIYLQENGADIRTFVL